MLASTNLKANPVNWSIPDATHRETTPLGEDVVPVQTCVAVTQTAGPSVLRTTLRGNSTPPVPDFAKVEEGAVAVEAEASRKARETGFVYGAEAWGLRAHHLELGKVQHAHQPVVPRPGLKGHEAYDGVELQVEEHLHEVVMEGIEGERAGMVPTMGKELTVCPQVITTGVHVQGIELIKAEHYQSDVLALIGCNRDASSEVTNAFKRLSISGRAFTHSLNMRFSIMDPPL